MAKLPCIPPEKLARILESCGFELERISGSHHFFHNPETKKSTVVPFHGKDVPKGLLNEILKEIDISREEFFDKYSRRKENIRVPSPEEGMGVARTAIECAPLGTRARETSNSRGALEEGCPKR